jgi:hypothetical protein
VFFFIVVTTHDEKSTGKSRMYLKRTSRRVRSFTTFPVSSVDATANLRERKRKTEKKSNKNKQKSKKQKSKDGKRSR